MKTKNEEYADLLFKRINEDGEFALKMRDFQIKQLIELCEKRKEEKEHVFQTIMNAIKEK